MIKEKKNFSKILFKNLNYNQYIEEQQFHKILTLNIKAKINYNNKIVKNHNENINPNKKNPFEPELDDLCRLHWLILMRKVTTILEFGVGKSTLIFNDAMKKNKKNYFVFFKKNLRRNNLFECHSVDNQKKWINKVRNNNLLDHIRFHFAELNTGIFNDRICTYYNPLPNICPDFIYLDGPDQSSSKGDVRGINTNHPDRLPMSADILSIEHFLLPGTLIVVDGRTANARFLKTNLQRNWIYCHDEKNDQHFFELSEKPLGVYNQKQIKCCLGNSYYSRIIS